jgi:hypothetical protein
MRLNVLSLAKAGLVAVPAELPDPQDPVQGLMARGDSAGGFTSRGSSSSTGTGSGSGGKSGGSSGSTGKTSGSSGTGKTSGSGRYPNSVRKSGRTKSGLKSGKGARSWTAYGAGGGLLLGAAYTTGPQCHGTSLYSPSGTLWGLGGCNHRQLQASQKVVRDVCGGAFNVTQDTAGLQAVGANRGVYYGAQNASAINGTDADFYTCLVDNSDAHYGLSDGAIAGIVVGSILGAALLVVGGCYGLAALRRLRNERSVSRHQAA